MARMTFTHSVEFNQLVFRFSDKPSAAIRGALKANDFRWSPSGGYWWRRSRASWADLALWIDRQLDSEAGIARNDGPCWDCKAEPAVFRRYGAATPVYCDACEAKRRAAEPKRGPYLIGRPEPAPDYSDRLYEDSCRDACGL